MRLRPDELVAGVPARKARELFRYFHDGIRIEGIADRLRLSKEDAAEVLTNLIEQGFVEPRYASEQAPPCELVELA